MALPSIRRKTFSQSTLEVVDYKSEELECQDAELSSKSDLHLALQIILHIPYGNLSAVEYASGQG